MPNDWSFRIEILKATHRWPWLVLACVLGAAAGWGIAAVWPSPYRITRELYVGLNVYRAINDSSVVEYSGIKLVNANDYKNWQMASLNTLIFTDTVIGETLHDLRAIDPYWNQVTATELAESLHVYWRNAGKWRLVAENNDPRRATDAVTTWEEVVLKHVHEAVLESQEAMVLDLQVRALEQNRGQSTARAGEMRQLCDELAGWKEQQMASAGDAPLNIAEHWQLWQKVLIAKLDESWKPLLDTFPSEGEPRQHYVAWIEKATPALQQEAVSQDKQARDLDAQLRATAVQFAEASQKSMGLSASLDVDKVSGSRAQQMIVRPTGILVLAGSLIGLFAWLAVWFSQISLRGHM